LAQGDAAVSVESNGVVLLAAVVSCGVAAVIGWRLR